MTPDNEPCSRYGNRAWRSALLRAAPAALLMAVVISTGADAAHAGAAQRGVRSALGSTHLARTARAVAYPLKVGPTGRYLVDQKNVPFLLAGDSPQALFVDLSARQANLYLADRQAAGFNAVWANLLCNTYTGGRRDGSTFDGIRPFKKPGDLSQPNNAYFSRVDDIIRLAAKHGIVVFLDPIETGGWLPTLVKNGLAKDYAYGRYLGKRYRSFPNIVWLNGNDFQSWHNLRDDAAVRAVARGIKATDPRHLQTLELNYWVSSSVDDPRWSSLLDINSAYTYYPTYIEVLKDYLRRPVRPIVMIEASYEWEHSYTGSMTLRRQEYWTALSGGAGQFYGDKYTWQFLPGWQEHLDTVGSTQLGYVTKLLANRPWYDLVPDTKHQVVTAGYGWVTTASSDVNTSDYVTAASTPNGKLVIAYEPELSPLRVDVAMHLPRLGRLTVDLARLAGPVKAQWYDPTAGTYTTVSGSPFDNKGTKAFTPPGLNSEQDQDWVLVLSAR